MKKKMLTITVCENCPHYAQYNGKKVYCSKGESWITSNPDEYRKWDDTPPNWCPLEDKPE